MRTCMLELERVSSPSVFSVPCRLQPKVLCAFNQGNAVFEVLIRKIKGQSSVLLSEAKSGRARFHFQLLKQRLKKSQSFSFASFTVKTGFSKQVIQSSVRGGHGYNQQLIENEENVTLGYSRKNPHTPDRWGRFLTPPLTWIS